MCLYCIVDGGILGVRMLSHGGDLVDTGGALSGIRDTKHRGYVLLLYERHHNGVYRWSGARCCHRAQ